MLCGRAGSSFSPWGARAQLAGRDELGANQPQSFNGGVSTGRPPPGTWWPPHQLVVRRQNGVGAVV
eukprot:11178704-Lingulodinium_polyedra.AAC.1